MNTNKSLILIILILLGISGYLLYSKDKTNSTQNQKGNNLITLEQTGISFELPKGHYVYEREGFEGGYGATVSIGREITPGYTKYSALEIRITPYVYDSAENKEYTPSDYVDVTFEKQEQMSEAKYTTLFGNKAVEYNAVVDNSKTILGYLNKNQSKMSEEYSVEISTFTYGTAAEFNQELLNTVLTTLKIVK